METVNDNRIVLRLDATKAELELAHCGFYLRKIKTVGDLGTIYTYAKSGHVKVKTDGEKVFVEGVYKPEYDIVFNTATGTISIHWDDLDALQLNAVMDRARELNIAEY